MPIVGQVKKVVKVPSGNQVSELLGLLDKKTNLMKHYREVTQAIQEANVGIAKIQKELGQIRSRVFRMEDGRILLFDKYGEVKITKIIDLKKETKISLGEEEEGVGGEDGSVLSAIAPSLSPSNWLHGEDPEQMESAG